MFHVRSIFPHQSRVDASSLELTPTNPQGEAVCCLFESYLAARPPAFRDKLSFLRKGDFELDWSAAHGGVALASLYRNGTPVSIAVLISGTDAETDANMLDVFRENVLNPLFENEFDAVLNEPLRPLALQVVFPDEPEWEPAVQLLTASLASVYFRTLLQLSNEDSATAACPPSSCSDND